MFVCSAIVAHAQKPPTTNNPSNPAKQDEVYYSTSPVDLHDGIKVGTLSVTGAEPVIEKLITDIQNNEYGPLASILVWHQDKLVFEMYANYGYENAPHFLMSVTKTLTSLLFSRAMELGYFRMGDLQKPVLDFFPDIDRANIQPEAAAVTLHEVLMMQSGFRGIKEWMKGDDLEGHRMIQKYFEQTTLPLDKRYTYAATDCNIVMSVIAELTSNRPDSSLPQYSTVWEFLEKEFLSPFGITNYQWSKASNGYPTSAAGCSLRSRDLLKIGIAMHQQGIHNGKQFFSGPYLDLLFNMGVRKKNRPHMSRPNGYIYFTEGIEYKLNGLTFVGVGGRGAAGQFMTSYPALDLVVVATSDNRGASGFGLDDARKAQVENLLPLFADNTTIQVERQTRCVTLLNAVDEGDRAE
jgi:CubicO group peptidase (beta-lactamase class C family)